MYLSPFEQARRTREGGGTDANISPLERARRARAGGGDLGGPFGRAADPGTVGHGSSIGESVSRAKDDVTSGAGRFFHGVQHTLAGPARAVVDAAAVPISGITDVAQVGERGVEGVFANRGKLGSVPGAIDAIGSGLHAMVHPGDQDTLDTQILDSNGDTRLAHDGSFGDNTKMFAEKMALQTVMDPASYVPGLDGVTVAARALKLAKAAKLASRGASALEKVPGGAKLTAPIKAASANAGRLGNAITDYTTADGRLKRLMQVKSVNEIQASEIKRANADNFTKGDKSLRSAIPLDAMDAIGVKKPAATTAFKRLELAKSKAAAAKAYSEGFGTIAMAHQARAEILQTRIDKVEAALKATDAHLESTLTDAGKAEYARKQKPIDMPGYNEADMKEKTAAIGDKVKDGDLPRYSHAELDEARAIIGREQGQIMVPATLAARLATKDAITETNTWLSGLSDINRRMLFMFPFAHMKNIGTDQAEGPGGMTALGEGLKQYGAHEAQRAANVANDVGGKVLPKVTAVEANAHRYQTTPGPQPEVSDYRGGTYVRRTVQNEAVVDAFLKQHEKDFRAEADRRYGLLVRHAVLDEETVSKEDHWRDWIAAKKAEILDPDSGTSDYRKVGDPNATSPLDNPTDAAFEGGQHRVDLRYTPRKPLQADSKAEALEKVGISDPNRFDKFTEPPQIGAFEQADERTFAQNNGIRRLMKMHGATDEVARNVAASAKPDWVLKDRLIAHRAKQRGYDALHEGNADAMILDPKRLQVPHPEYARQVIKAAGIHDAAAWDSGMARLHDRAAVSKFADEQNPFKGSNVITKGINKFYESSNSTLWNFDAAQRMALDRHLLAHDPQYQAWETEGTQSAKAQQGARINGVLFNYYHQSEFARHLRMAGAPFPHWRLGNLERQARQIKEDPSRMIAYARTEAVLNASYFPDNNPKASHFEANSPIDEAAKAVLRPRKYALGTLGPLGLAMAGTGNLLTGTTGDLPGEAAQLGASYLPFGGVAEDLTNTTGHPEPAGPIPTTAMSLAGTYMKRYPSALTEREETVAVDHPELSPFEVIRRAKQGYHRHEHRY